MVADFTQLRTTNVQHKGLVTTEIRKKSKPPAGYLPAPASGISGSGSLD